MVAAASGLDTTVFAHTSPPAVWTNTEPTGSTAFDTASLTGVVGGFTPTRDRHLQFLRQRRLHCPGCDRPDGQPGRRGGARLGPDPPLAAGSYSFQAVYSGDSNYHGPTSACEPFTVATATPATQTSLVVNGLFAHETATVTGVPNFTPAGTLTYSLFSAGDCAGTATTEMVTLTATGTVPDSSTIGPLSAGNYSYQATYNGDSNYGSTTSDCEPFTVDPATSATSTAVFDNATKAAGTDTEPTGSSAFDTATVTPTLPAGVTRPAPTGTVTYFLFKDGSCTATTPPSPHTVVTLAADGTVPNSNPTPPLARGSHSFQATYSGDSNYKPSTSSCEPYRLDPRPSNTTTVVFDDATNAAWTGAETTGAFAYDTATVTGVAGIIPSGTETYTFFTNGDCSGASSSTSTETLTATGSVPNSDTEGPLAAGSYT